MSDYRFPIAHGGSVPCFNCKTPIPTATATESGFPTGTHKARCPQCHMTTWFDYPPEVTQ